MRARHLRRGTQLQRSVVRFYQADTSKGSEDLCNRLSAWDACWRQDGHAQKTHRWHMSRFNAWIAWSPTVCDESIGHGCSILLIVLEVLVLLVMLDVGRRAGLYRAVERRAESSQLYEVVALPEDESQCKQILPPLDNPSEGKVNFRVTLTDHLRFCEHLSSFDAKGCPVERAMASAQASKLTPLVTIGETLRWQCQFIRRHIRKGL